MKPKIKRRQRVKSNQNRVTPNKVMPQKQTFFEFLRDKNGRNSLRELIVLISMLCLIISWLAHQFWKYDVPEYIYYSFVSMVGAGCFGYSMEKRNTSETF